MSDMPIHEDRDALFERLRGGASASEASIGTAIEVAAVGPSAAGGVIVPLSFATSGGPTAVTVLPPIYADVEAVTEGAMSAIEMYANMCGLSQEGFRALRWPDAEKIIVAARHLAPEIKRL